MSGASGRQRVSTGAFDSLSMLAPDLEIAAAFERVAGPLLEAAYSSRQQQIALAGARELLLPRLVTGQLDISDVDLGALESAAAA